MCFQTGVYEQAHLLPEKALKSFTFSEFWWSKVVIFKNCCFNQLARSSSNAFLYHQKQTKETMINMSASTLLPFHVISLVICICYLPNCTYICFRIGQWSIKVTNTSTPYVHWFEFQPPHFSSNCQLMHLAKASADDPCAWVPATMWEI